MRSWSRLVTYIVKITIIAISISAVAVLFLKCLPREVHLHGLLVDLELRDPDPSRYPELREALTQRIPPCVPIRGSLRVTMDYCHFSEIDPNCFKTEYYDFLVLSPQGTPWHRYRDPYEAKLRGLKELVQRVAMDHKLPVLGICGGHQFMALAFGGTVGFIDPKFEALPMDHYPKEARAERGVVSLTTLRDDPIFSGITTHPGSFAVMESHYEEVKTIPPPFVNLARSEMSEIQLIRIPGQIVYGTAFHPERGWSSDGQPLASSGKQILTNFLKMVVVHKRP